MQVSCRNFSRLVKQTDPRSYWRIAVYTIYRFGYWSKVKTYQPIRIDKHLGISKSYPGPSETLGQIQFTVHYYMISNLRLSQGLAGVLNGHASRNFAVLIWLRLKLSFWAMWNYIAHITSLVLGATKNSQFSIRTHFQPERSPCFEAHHLDINLKPHWITVNGPIWVLQAKPEATVKSNALMKKRHNWPQDLTSEVPKVGSGWVGVGWVGKFIGESGQQRLEELAIDE